jgi:arylamine N-acetyltransferase
MKDGIPLLNQAQLQSLVERLSLPSSPVSLDLTYLTQVQWAYLCHSVFHNIYLLAGYAGYAAPLTAKDSLNSILANQGGLCHVQTVGFLSLLRGFGFHAHLVAATINAPGDHLVIRVDLANKSYLCDVGNGHPYRRPFPLDKADEQAWMGWRFRTQPEEGKLCLQRWLGKTQRERWKTVYWADFTPRHFDYFTESLRHHHTQTGYGPFLQHLRAVRIFHHGLISIRNGLYKRYSMVGKVERPIRGFAAAKRLLQTQFGLAQAPIDKALAVYQAHQVKPWAMASPHPEFPRLLVTVSTTDRPQCLRSLGESLLKHAQGQPLTLLVVENSVEEQNRQANLTVLQYLRKHGLKINDLDDCCYGKSIADSRRTQTRWVAHKIAQGQQYNIIWMLDDDLRLTNLSIDNEGEVEETDDFNQIQALSTLWQEHPEISLAIGGITGDPPIRPDAVLRTQLFDLLANLEWFSALKPQAIYPSPSQQAIFSLPDYYYDHSEAGKTHLFTPFRWLKRSETSQWVRDQFLAYLRAAQGISSGKSVTRPLLLRHDFFPYSSVLRGGNAAFFDIDVFMAHTYPSVSIDQITSRRSDMLGAILLRQTYPAGIYAVNVPLQHNRQPADKHAGFKAGQLDSERLWESMISEILGVVLIRCILSTPERKADDRTMLKEKLYERSLCLENNIQMAWCYLQRIQQQIKTDTTTWWHSDEAIMQSLETLLTELETLLRLYREPTGSNQTSLLKRLQSYVTNPRLIEQLNVELAKFRTQPTLWLKEMQGIFQSKEYKHD